MSVPNNKAGNFKRHAKALVATFDKFAQIFLDEIKSKYSFPKSAIDRIDELLHYTCLGGKYNRGGLVLNTLEHLCESPTETQREQAMACAWAIEALQAMFLVADDVMDGSVTRRGKPCWYKKPEVQLDAVNDSLILETFVFFLLKEFFGDDVNMYFKLNELYRETSFQTQLGQMLDLTSQPQGRKDPELLEGFTLENYLRIITYKTAFYSFYLPIAAGMIITGNDSPNALAVAKQLCIEIGVKFQIQDDYLDCYGDPEVIGKVGTDMKDHKLTWLCAMALQQMSKSQRATFEQHYGHETKEDEAVIRGIYTELELKEQYLKQEADSFASISSQIEANADVLPPAIFSEILYKIHLRQK